MDVFIDIFLVEMTQAIAYHSTMKMKSGILCVASAGLMLNASVSAAIDYESGLGSTPGGVAMICDTTIPAYADSFQDGGKAVILADLIKSEAFEALDPFQQSAFARLLGQTTKLPAEQASQECHRILEEFDARGNVLSLQYCKNWALSVHGIARLQMTGELTDSVSLSMAGGNPELNEVIRSVANQAENLREGATAETLAQAHYYTCFKNVLNEKGI